MTKSRRLRPVRDVASSRERDAASRLAEARSAAAREAARLKELEAYRAEYARMIDRQTLPAERLAGVRLFLANLNRAIAQQAERLRVAEQRQAGFHRAWMSLRTRALALDKVGERYAREEAAETARREQRDADEWAIRRPVEEERD